MWEAHRQARDAAERDAAAWAAERVDLLDQIRELTPQD